VDPISGAGPVPVTNCPASVPTDFAVFSGVLPPGPITDPFFHGPQDFAVTDAHPLPTSKDQCKNGGWQDFGVFKNQGDCVSFVATGGKNLPSGH
jgi:hypothetical protein